jgi:hypothetical protein
MISDNLVNQLLGLNVTFLSEADKEDKDNPDNTEDKNDLNNEKNDNSDNEDDIAKDDTSDDSADTPEDTTETEDNAETDSNPDSETDSNPDSETDTSDAPNDNELKNNLSKDLNNIDWEKKLYISNQFEEIYSAFNNLSKFITDVILKTSSNINSEYILKGILTKVTFNINHIREILEGTLLIDLDYKDLDKLLDIFSKDVENISKQLKLFSKNIENDAKK